MQSFLLRKDDYPLLYWSFKALAAAISLVGAILLIDYYQPSIVTTDTVIEKEVDVSVSGKVSYTVFTYSGILEVDQEEYQAIQSGMVVERHYSKWFDIKKGIRFSLDEDSLWIYTENIYTLNAFFAKLLLASIFTVLFQFPAFWMVAITLIDVIVLLVFSGLPFMVIFLSGFVLATVIFVFSLQPLRKPQARS